MRRMGLGRTTWILAGLIAVLGCNNFRDLFSAHADVAAEAAGQELTAQRLAEIMGQTKGVDVTREAAEFVANIWVDYTLFSQALASGRNLSDSTIIVETMWPQIAQVTGDRWFDSILARRLRLPAGTEDSVYNAGELRLVQHILYTVPQTAGGTERQDALRKAQATLGRIRGGADFGALASAESQDFQSARDSGYLRPAPRNSWVTSVDSAIWSLAPGAVSGVVESPYGYHIIKRPTAADARSRIRGFLEADRSATLDSIYRDSVAAARGLELTGSAVALMRTAIDDPDEHRTSGKKIVDYSGGGFTVADFLHWIYAFPPQVVAQVKQATDDQLKEMVTFFAQNAMLLEQADSAGIGLTADEWASLRQTHRAGIDTLRSGLGLGYEISDSSLAEAERTKLAALRLDAYFNDLITGKSRPRSMPATLSAYLRQHGEYRVNEAGLSRAMELAQAKKTADSTAAVDSLNQPAPVTPPPLDSAGPASPIQEGGSR
jgi:PPIC-type PPIASE domain